MSGEARPAAPVAASAEEAAVGAVLDGLRTFRHNWWAPVLLGVIMLFDSWDSIAIAYAMPPLSAEWKLDPLTMGYIISAGYGGQFIGAFSLGALAERFGRLPVLSAAIGTMGVLALACGFSHDYTTLLALRFVQGLAIGGAMPVAITYVNELAPTKTRGRYFGLFQTLAIAGFGAASLTSPLIIPTLGWRWMLGLGGLPLVLLPLVWITLPESPRWLARIGRAEAANRALVKLGGAPVAFTGDGGRTQASGPTAARPGLTILASPAFRSQTLTVTILWFFTMFTSFGITTWLPSIYVDVFHIPVPRALQYSAIGSFAILAALAAAGPLIDRFGRRVFPIGGLALTALIFLGMAAHRPDRELILVPLVAVGQVAIFFGAFTVWPYTAETFPTHMRALALGWASSVGRAASMLTPIFVGFVLSKGAAIEIVFGIFGLFALVACLVWVTRTRETAGKPLETI